MMVMFVSQCQKNALKKTRRVLDAFADRIGDNTWRTVITEDGLLAVKKLLRQTASKNTAVSCHWIRSRARSELVWVVGNRGQFDSEGRVAVNSTQKPVQPDESEWVYLPIIRTLTALAALLHDWGKASKVFQEKLLPKSKNKQGDPIRHEWISCVLLDAFIRSCQSNQHDWVVEMALGNIKEETLKTFIPTRPEKLFVGHDALAQVLMWLIVSHHRLPLPFGNEDALNSYKGVEANTMALCLQQITTAWGYENRKDEAEFSSRVKGCFEFPNGLITHSSLWLKDVKRWAAKLVELRPKIQEIIENNNLRLVLHHARLCLMLGDHHYSSLPEDKNWKSDVHLFANTDKKTKQLKQKLDEHLVGVKKHALDVANLLPSIQRLEYEEAASVFGCPALRKPSTGDYAWQQKAVNCIADYKKNYPIEGAFIVNMASTGCGKTFANAKIMQALSPEGNGLRFVLALGLRTLTLQTGDEYRDRVGLDADELAVLIGSKAVSELHNSAKESINNDQQDLTVEEAGSESLETLLDNEIDFGGILPDGNLATILKDKRARQFLYAPVLACTIDHMMGATETKRGGRYILPSLRLLSSDLVIDEVDDFIGEDLATIGRLVHLAGMLGRKVMISSATIPPALAEGYFNAYRLGWQLFSVSQNKRSSICCIWTDEFNSHSLKAPADEKGTELYRQTHSQFIQKRIEKLEKQPSKRKANIIQCPFAPANLPSDDSTKMERYFQLIWQAIQDKHSQHNTRDEISGKQVSFGVVRVANIPTCVNLSAYLLGTELPLDTDVRVMAYHSQQILLMRHAQEQHLDAVLKRKEAENQQPKAFSNTVIRAHLNKIRANNCLFILVATPVEEVGRDHDFDWAIVEPSSYRSIIQLAGRVRRHRSGATCSPNIGLLQYNWRSFKESDKNNNKYFVRPGYEAEMKNPLPTHDISQLLDVSAINMRLDAVPRIQEPVKHEKNQLFAGIEHGATKRLLTDYSNINVSNIQGYLQHAWWLTALPQVFQSFRKSKPSVALFYVWDDKKQRFYWAEKDEDGNPVSCSQRRGIRQSALESGSNQRLWLLRDYSVLLKQQAERNETSLRAVSLRYGELCLTIYNDNDEFEYCPQLGMYKA